MIAARSAACVGGLGAEVGEVDVAVGVAGDRHDLDAGHRRRWRGWCRGREVGIRQMWRWLLAARLVVRADGEQPGVFALRAGVGLEGDGGEAGDFGEPASPGRVNSLW